MVHGVEYDVERTRTLIPCRENTVSGPIQVSGADNPWLVIRDQRVQYSAEHGILLLLSQDVCVFQTQAFGKVLVLDGEPCIR